MYISIGSIIIDDIILPDGQTKWGVFGGGSTHAIVGMKVWADSVGISAWAGTNFPPEMEADLARHFDLTGVIRRDLPTARAWQLFEEDGRRVEVFRTDMSTFVKNSPGPDELPAAYWRASGIHFQNDVLNRFSEWIDRFRSNGSGPILWEPWGELAVPEKRQVFNEAMALVDVVSPNLLEGQTLTGLQDAETIARALLDDGAKMVALRMGADGSLVMDERGRMARVPAAPVEKIVDVTGAGNAYCGGFLVGYAETGDMVQAACMGAVSASFALGQFGALYPFEGVRERARAALANLRALVQAKDF
ncbi:MAG TPA: PfkB family carbohydrate kinase [Anaerolineaceae bacterium]